MERATISEELGTEVVTVNHDGTSPKAKLIEPLFERTVTAESLSSPHRLGLNKAEFYARYGEWSVAALLGEAGVDRDDLIADLQALVPPAIEAAKEDGRLAALIRARKIAAARSSPPTKSRASTK